MSSDFAVFEYMYRDAGNWKTFGALRLVGDAVNAKARLYDYLESGELFVAEQVGIPSLCQLHWATCGDGPSDLDHAYHEFMDLRPATSADADAPAIALSVDELLTRFSVAAQRWDVTLSPNCWL